MSKKGLIFLALVAAAGFALTRQKPPLPDHATAADSVANAEAGYGVRFKYGLGALGAKMVGNTVRKGVAETELALKQMAPAVKKARGGDAMRAKEYSKRIVTRDSAALEDLRFGRPVSAVRNYMEAKNLVNAVREQTKRGF